jgi:hypothetical protein
MVHHQFFWLFFIPERDEGRRREDEGGEMEEMEARDWR